MAFLEEWIPGMLVGAGAAFLAPKLIKLTRPVSKTLVKTGMVLFESSRESLAEAQEQISDIVAEARSELQEEKPAAGAASKPRGRKATKAAPAAVEA
jgi:hypothetical protein